MFDLLFASGLVSRQTSRPWDIWISRAWNSLVTPVCTATPTASITPDDRLLRLTEPTSFKSVFCFKIFHAFILPGELIWDSSAVDGVKVCNLKCELAFNVESPPTLLSHEWNDPDELTSLEK
jgi:hypothetical protein